MALRQWLRAWQGGLGVCVALSQLRGAGLRSASKEKYPLEERDSSGDLRTKMKRGERVAKGPGLAGGPRAGGPAAAAAVVVAAAEPGRAAGAPGRSCAAGPGPSAAAAGGNRPPSPSRCAFTSGGCLAIGAACGRSGTA